MQRRIRLDKFALVLPQAMRESQIDLWIVAMKQNHPDPLWEDLGGGFIGATGYFVFADRGDRVEKAAFDIDGLGLEGPGGYDFVNPTVDLATFVRQRDPKRIGLNMSDDIGAADGLTFTHHRLLVKTARRAVRVPVRVGREARVRLPIAPRGARDRGVRRGGRPSRACWPSARCPTR